LEPWAGSREKKISERGPGDQEDQDGSGGRREHGHHATEEPPEQEAAEDRQEHGSGDGKGDRPDVDEAVGQDRLLPMRVDEGLESLAMLFYRLDREIAVQAGGQDSGGREREASQGRVAQQR
jgi:hypothetical protein